MTSSYNRNIERLRAGNRQVSLEERNNRTEAANLSSQRRLDDTQNVINALSKLSPTLQKAHDAHQEKIAEEAAQEVRDAEVQKSQDILAHKQRIQDMETAKKAGELLLDFETLEEQERRLLELKQEYLAFNGAPNFYDASAISSLSGAAQAGHVREKLRMFTERLPSLFTQEFQNSQEEFSLQGITFTADQLRENSLALPQKEFAINVLMERVLERAGIYEYTPEMLLLNGITGEKGIVERTKSAARTKATQEYNIAKGELERKRYQLQFTNSLNASLGNPEKNGEALAKLHLAYATTPTVDGNSIIGQAEAWKMTYNYLAEKAGNDANFADEVGSWIIPDWLAAKVGAKKGSTYGDFWGGRIKGLKDTIKSGAVSAAKAEKAYLDSKGVELTNTFKQEVQNGAVKTGDDIKTLKIQFTNLGLTVPEDISNYDTLLDRKIDDDVDLIEKRMAYNQGSITHQELNQYHPEAAAQFRERATKFEKAEFTSSGAEGFIKAELNDAFDGMGVKGNEKTPEYKAALYNAVSDYKKKYNNLIAMNYAPDRASYLALHGPAKLVTKEGVEVPDSEGVITEIKRNKGNTKYRTIGQNLEETGLKADHVRSSKVLHAKKELVNLGEGAESNTIIGGKYGKDQITSIAANIDKYGVPGLYHNLNALQYYKGIALGKGNMDAYSLIDKQLKVLGHKGLWPSGNKPKLISLLEAQDSDGTAILSPETQKLALAINRSRKYPSVNSYLYNKNLMRDGANYGNSLFSSFDSPENLIIGVG
tara:strand:+ start:618 stop:2915 length:2298 start_codon:yes stop_codon:yes gene_type:complete